ncbi:unnamed protein product [Medioppia subpectinata]|uniref:ABC transporter domain-containing protein n=1 Tax=Medioppia subpectinata TaxID=1979941 RepID=A0A7R9Q025_9ACAR|nr:unnamed protein product [Medioppia subpectinata]CAG2107671.1 unnamed protein product [Medioppia subpectinata]
MCDNYIDVDLREPETKPRIAVHVRNVNFSYTKNAVVLERMNLKIEEGKIFGLLGSNGSGKTTLLRLILGRLKPHSGYVSVFGRKPGTVGSDVPGPGVGYMPQDVALYYEFTIEETLTYYGLLNHMTPEDINIRINLLTDLLSIPDRKRVLTKLSGGQQRLISMAVTMIHSPRLLILDEPTVGVDSLIRCRIWTYLENISKNDGVTIIVTTHYIEEAKSAAYVGFVSNGYLLSQSTPQQLLNQYRVKTLEEVYYKLAIIRRRSRRMSLNPLLFNDAKDAQEVETENQKFDYRGRNHGFINMGRMSALLWRNYIKLTRNPLMVICFYALSALIVTLMSLVFTQNFENIPIAIYNGERPPELSELFLKHIDDRKIHVTLYDSYERAVQSVIDGQNLMSLDFSANFSAGVEERFQSPQDVSEQAILDSQVKITVDMSRPIVAGVTDLALLSTLNAFIKEYSVSLDYNPLSFSMPFDLNASYYSFKPSFKDFVAPGMLLAIQYGLNMVLTGALDVLLMLIVQGMHGMVFGMILSLAVSNDYNVIMVMALTTLPLWMVSGLLWPLESLSDLAHIAIGLQVLDQSLFGIAITGGRVEHNTTMGY